MIYGSYIIWYTGLLATAVTCTNLLSYAIYKPLYHRACIYFTYIYTHTHPHTSTHTHIHIHIHTYTYRHKHTRIYMHSIPQFSQLSLKCKQYRYLRYTKYDAISDTTVCMYVCVCVCIYVCAYVFKSAYVGVYIYKQRIHSDESTRTTIFTGYCIFGYFNLELWTD